LTKKTLKVCYNVSLSTNFQQQSCSAINYLSNGINILAGWPLSRKNWA